jgi:predicted oxidoreductase
MSTVKRVVLREIPGQPATTLSVSRLVLGFWRLDNWGYSADDLAGLLAQCVEMGITTFDHADIYGDYRCESLFGDAIKRMPQLKQQCEIVTKCNIKLISEQRAEHRLKSYDTSAEHIIASAHRSLSNLNVERLDLLLLHRPDPLMEPAEVAEAFSVLHRAGDVAHFGVSNHSPAQFEMLSYYVEQPLVTNQVECSVLHHQALTDGSFDHALMHHYKPMIWSPFGGGALFQDDAPTVQRVRTAMARVSQHLAGCSVDQLALAWLLRHPAQLVPVLGSGRLPRIQAAVAAQSLCLSREDWFEIYEAARGREVD